jgi:AraC-like DNA-binding protein
MFPFKVAHYFIQRYSQPGDLVLDPFSGRGTVRGYPGNVISANPGEVHDGRPHGTSTRRWRILCVDVDVMAGATERHARDAEIVQPVIDDPVLLGRLRRLFSRQEHLADALAFEESLVECCVCLMARHSSAPCTTAVPSQDVRRVRERLADDSSNVPSLGELAVMTGLSKYQVLRRFQRAYGLPPHAWLLRQRAERARVLIREGRPLATAAAASGFVDQSHMNRVFVRQFGFTPGAWRRASRPSQLQ